MPRAPVIFVLALMGGAAAGQVPHAHDAAMHAGHPEPAAATDPPTGEPTPDDAGHPMDPAEHLRMMKAMRGPLGIPMQQNASGTAWQPRSSPMYGHMALLGDWSFMLHYLVFAGVDLQGSRRGGVQGATTNWVMGMAQRRLWGGQFTTRVMLSLEAPLMGPAGYPLLLQTGETLAGRPLVDRQHPHDVFMELAVRYAHPVGVDWALELYLAPAGEPALGPVAYPHRISASSDPFAPLSHHWQDSTHISFGVITVGAYSRFLKVEASAFNAHEPDENRFDLDLRAPDSFAARVTANPWDDWSAQVSYGYLRDPEGARAAGDVQRLTASVSHNLQLPGGGNWSSTVVWGQNLQHGVAPSNSVLLESNVFYALNSVFARAEYVLKDGAELGMGGALATRQFPLGAVSVGYIRHVGRWSGLIPGIGVRAAIDFVPETLPDRYGTRTPLGMMIFARLQPDDMMAGMPGMP